MVINQKHPFGCFKILWYAYSKFLEPILSQNPHLRGGFLAAVYLCTHLCIPVAQVKLLKYIILLSFMN